jgi:hypothetical protein
VTSTGPAYTPLPREADVVGAPTSLTHPPLLLLPELPVWPPLLLLPEPLLELLLLPEPLLELPGWPPLLLPEPPPPWPGPWCLIQSSRGPHPAASITRAIIIHE